MVWQNSSFLVLISFRWDTLASPPASNFCSLFLLFACSASYQGPTGKKVHLISTDSSCRNFQPCLKVKERLGWLVIQANLVGILQIPLKKKKMVGTPADTSAFSGMLKQIDMIFPAGNSILLTSLRLCFCVLPRVEVANDSRPCVTRRCPAG